MAHEYERLLPAFPEFCACDVCRDDVIVYTLNRLPPRYVTQRRGAVLAHLRVQRDQEVADVSVALMQAFMRVQDAPRPGVEHRLPAGSGG